MRMGVRISGVIGGLSILMMVFAVLLFAFSPLPLWGQSVSTGTVVGTVTDNSGAVVGGATVTLVDKATGDSRSTTTNEVGHYIFSNVNPSTYTLKFRKAGFAELQVASATVQVGTQLTENVQMKLGSVSTTVTVTETAGAQLQTMNSTIGSTISGTALQSLPSIGRDVSTFAVLQPGVGPDGSVAGAVVDQSTFMLDGGNNTNDMDGSMQVYTPSFADDTTGGVVGGANGTTGNMGSPPPTGVMPTPVDSVEEIKVNTANQTADFNNSAGSQVEVVTKRGANSWHGTAYEYYRDNNFSGNTWDNNLSDTAVPSYHYSRFGFAGGGPIIPKSIWGGKTYFFANYEGFRWPQSATYERPVPSANMRAGILTFDDANGNPVQYNVQSYDPRGIGINPLVAQLWNTYEPMPNDPSCGTLLGSYCDGVNEQGYKANMLLPERTDFGVARIDHDFGSKWHFMSSYRVYRELRATNSQVDIGGFFSGDTLGTPASLSNRPQQPWYYVAGLTTNISPNVTNDFHYSYLRNFWACGTAGALEPFGEHTSGGLPTVLAPYNVNTQQVRTRFWDGHDNFLRDDVTVLHGNHLFQFGGQYQRNWNYHQRTDNGGGINYTLTYQLGDSLGAGLVDLSSVVAAGYPSGTAAARAFAAVTGIVTDSQIAYTRSGPNLTLNPPFTPAYDQSTIPYYNVYFGDSWHLKPSLTLSYGLGYTLEMPPTEVAGRQVEVVDASGQLLDVEGYLNQRKAAALKGQVYNPEVGFALVGNTGAGRKYPYDPFYGSFSPRVAVAWNPQFQSDNFLGRIFGQNSSVIRGGYNRIYGRLNGVDLVLVPLLGTGLIQPVQCLQAFSNGSCGPGNPTAANAFRIGVDGSTAPLPAATPTLPQPVFPGINSVAAGAGEGFDVHFRPNVVDSFDLTIQRQFGPKMMLEVGYIGRRITHEYLPININAVPYMMTLNGQSFAQAYAAVETAMGCATSAAACGATPNPTVASQPFFEAALSGTGYCNGFSNCTAAVVSKQFNNFASQSVWSLWSSLDNGAFNFPRTMLNTPLNCPTGTEIGCSGELTSGVGDNASVGYGNYNGAFASFKTTDWHGLTTQQNFTFSKALGTGAFVQATSEYTADDPFNLKEGYGPQAFDRKFVYNLFMAYSPSVYKGQQGLLGHLLGGWSFAPIFAAGSGAPVICNTQTGGDFTGGSDAQSFGAADGVNFFESANCEFTKPISGSASAHSGVPGSGGVGTATADQGLPGYPLRSAEVNLFSDPLAVYNSVRPAILGIDQRAGGEGAVRGLPYWNMDFSVTKDIRISERFGLQFQSIFVNVLNHNVFFDPVLDLTNASGWGVLNAQVNTPREIQLGLRVNF
jgi:Carboxypeptidase regulatory-like domain